MAQTKPLCFHCGDACRAGSGLSVKFDGAAQPVCCVGCQAVAELIIESGQADYYRYRAGLPRRPDDALLDRLSDWDVFDQQDQHTDAGGCCQTQVALGGMHCAACGWLVERQLSRQPGVAAVRADFQRRLVVISWQPTRCSLSTLLKVLVRLGYSPRPIEQAADLALEERHAAIRRLGVAGLGMMQVMMYVVGTYFGTDQDMQPAVEKLLHLVSFVITSVVLLYSGQPFLSGARRALSAGSVNMDVPVAAALLLAYGASCFNLLAGTGAVYFESVTMFIFFLLLGRFVEMSVRHRAIDIGEALGQILPEAALLVRDGTPRSVLRSSLQNGQQIHVRVGDAFAADGVLLSATEIDESLLTGEARPRRYQAGDTVHAGTINLGQATDLTISATGQQLFVSQLERLLGAARVNRPVHSQGLASGASLLILAVLMLAAVVYWFWLSRDSVNGFEAALAVLIVTCPCALSLAVPSVLAATSCALAGRGLLVANTQSLFALARVDRVLFDKTGTLTLGRPRIARVQMVPDHPAAMAKEDLLALVAAAERGIAHPVARAFDDFDQGLEATEVTAQPGRGIRATVAGRPLRIGRPEQGDYCGTAVVVEDGDGVLARILLRDEARPSLRGLMARLSRRGLTPAIASGDGPDAVRTTADSAGIAEFRARLTPQDKLQWLDTLQREGHTVLAVGDGINDAPLLGGADVSVAMASGSGLAQSGADMVLTGELSAIADGVDAARRMQRIARQNYAWAVAYNLVAIPLAAAGLVAPWLAAIGMSASSLIVVANASRASRWPRGQSTVKQTRELPA